MFKKFRDGFIFGIGASASISFFFLLGNLAGNTLKTEFKISSTLDCRINNALRPLKNQSFNFIQRINISWKEFTDDYSSITPESKKYLC